MRTFSLFVHTVNSVVPSLIFEIVSDEARVRLLAEKALADKPDWLLAEIRDQDRLLFSIDRNGVSWAHRESGRSGETWPKGVPTGP